jgi:polysaccharide biosynthesis/export protein
MRDFRSLFLLATITLLSACSSYKQNILFKTESANTIDQSLLSPNSNKKIDLGDYLDLEVFTKNGEKIIDPDFELSNSNINTDKLRPKLKYLVRNDGLVKVPMVGDVKLLGLTLNEAEDFLQKKYEVFYHNAYVNLEFLNKRVVILGSPGGKVIPLENENTTLVEIIAQAEGIDNFGKGQNIRVLRDDQVFLIDLSTFEGYKKGNIIIEPGDVIYVEPVRRPFTEFMKDNGSFISVFSSIVSLVAVLISIK